MSAPAPLKIGIVYETHETYVRAPGDPVDFAAEYEPLETIEALEAAIASLGHRSQRLGPPQALLEAIGKGELAALDCALSIAEGHGSRNREAWAPVLLEMAGVPLLGSDALTLSTSLDKAWTLARVAGQGVPVLPHVVFTSAAEVEGAALPADFPLFVKPRAEGTAKGITRASRVETRAELLATVERLVDAYGQPALVEAFAPGAEYTVTVVGNAPSGPRALPVLQRAIEVESGIGLHALERDAAPPAPSGGYAHHTPGSLDAALESALKELALRSYEALECRDFARVDFKLDAKGGPAFLEINTLPTFAPDGSFGILAELAGQSFAEFVAEVLAGGLERLGLPRRGEA
ncbi:MAG: D-alanine--D-alanine ligase [Myxococcota bacterium]|nr:D-alanine--D-alanine ligase [Myxococcota bacterium]